MYSTLSHEPGGGLYSEGTGHLLEDLKQMSGMSRCVFQKEYLGGSVKNKLWLASLEPWKPAGGLLEKYS